MKSILHKPFTIACIIVGIFLLLWLRGCFCNSNHSTNPELKVYKDSVTKLNKNLSTIDKELMLTIKKFSGIILFNSNRADSFEQLRDEDLKLLVVSGKRATPLIQYVRHDSLSTKQCDSLADEFSNYMWANELEKQVTDSLLASKDFQIAVLDSSLENYTTAYITCKNYFKASTELFGATYMAYQKIKPRNVVSLLAAGQYYEGLNKVSVGGGLSFKNKRNYSLSALVLFSDNRVYQLQISTPISFRKK